MDVKSMSTWEFRGGWWKKAKCKRGFELSPKTGSGETILTWDFMKEATWANQTQNLRI